MKQFLSLIILFGSSLLWSQDYDNYIGAGNTDGITITSSSAEPNNEASKVIDGSGLDAAKMEAGRFLSQAAWGGDMDAIQDVIDMGFEEWLDDQETKPISSYYDELDDIWDEIYNVRVSAGEDPDEIFGPFGYHFNYAWFEVLMTKEDELRQRMAYALSQILVTSLNSNLVDYLETVPRYYDLLMSHALGNYEDLLYDVSVNIAMGTYLSHLNNPKEDPANNIHPDENYAREIMQLFSIGLYELGIDGEPLEDLEGDWIPTYDNEDIKQLAKVFTGLGPGDINMYVDWTDEPYFGLGLWGADLSVPMIMYQDWHDTGTKTLLGGSYVIPAGQDGMQDIEDAVAFLFDHDNVAPFISKQLIQRLIKSNPTPAYVQRVAEIFEDNGSGERGDLFAVAKAILLDTEARDCVWIQDESNGKLKEPLLALAQISKSLPVTSENGHHWNNGFDLLWDAGQYPMWSPSVFNFYRPDHVPNGPILDDDLVAPEFQIFNTLTSVGMLNKIHSWTLWNSVYYDWEDDELFGNNTGQIDTDWLENTVNDIGVEGFVNELDILLTHGELSDQWREEIRTATESFDWGDYYHATLALYLTMSHPDYMIDK